MQHRSLPLGPPALLIALGLVVVEGSALAQSSQAIAPVDDGSSYRPPPPPPKPDRETISRSYMQMSMGFLDVYKRQAQARSAEQAAEDEGVEVLVGTAAFGFYREEHHRCLSLIHI